MRASIQFLITALNPIVRENDEIELVSSPHNSAGKQIPTSPKVASSSWRQGATCLGRKVTIVKKKKQIRKIGKISKIKGAPRVADADVRRGFVGKFYQ